MIVSTPEKVVYVRVLTEKKLAGKLLEALQSAGSLHPEVLTEISEKDREILSKEAERLRKLERVLSEFDAIIPRQILVKLDGEISASKLHDYLLSLLSKLSEALQQAKSIKAKIEQISEEITKSEEILWVLSILSAIPKYSNAPIDNVSFNGNIVAARTILLEKDLVDEFLAELPEDLKQRVVLDIVTLKEYRKAVIIVAGPRGDVETVNEISRSVGGKVIEIPEEHVTISEFLKKLKVRIKDLHAELGKLKDEFEKLVSKVSKDLALGKVVVTAYRDRLQVLLSALKGRYLVAVEGWVPLSSRKWLEDFLYSGLKYVYVVDSPPPPGKTPPTKLKNPHIFKPYEMITKIYGVPNYNEYDPTPIITYSLTLFFGLMFADVVYGTAMFIIVNYLLEKTGFIENPYSEGYRLFKRLCTYLSLSSIFFGLLSNSFAGYSIVFNNGRISFVASSGSTLQALLPLLNPMFFINLALIIGLVHVNIAHILSFIKYIKLRDKGEIISKVGFFISEVFGIPYILYKFLNVSLPAPLNSFANYLVYGIVVGLSLLIVGKLIAYKALGSLFWLFDLTGLLGDVMSYTRLAGIGLATTLLAQNFNSLSLELGGAVSSAVPMHALGLVLGAIAAFIVMVLTNLLNIAFGIIGAFVHSLRLCFVEFLPKFYEGDGKEFRPFTIKVEDAILIGSGGIHSS